MRPSVLILVCLIPGVSNSHASARVLTGPLSDVPESASYFYWGDGVNDLFQAWSSNDGETAGFFYSSTSGTSNADVYVYSGLTDPTTVRDATVFPYVTRRSVLAFEGDTVFFRGTNGFYGAWRIDEIYPAPLGELPDSYLNGRWYYQDNGTGDFVPEPSTLLLALAGFGLLGIRSR